MRTMLSKLFMKAARALDPSVVHVGSPTPLMATAMLKPAESPEVMAAYQLNYLVTRAEEALGDGDVPVDARVAKAKEILGCARMIRDIGEHGLRFKFKAEHEPIM